jgi:hypothetical protein
VDPLNLTPKMRVAYDMIHSDGSVEDGNGVSLATVCALRDRGFIQLDFTGRNKFKQLSWIARPLGSGPLPKRPKKSLATAVVVSRALGSFRGTDDTRFDKYRPAVPLYGNVERSGYRASESGVTNRVFVSYVPAADEPEETTWKVGKVLLKDYTTYLTSLGYDVINNGGTLYVSRPPVQ